MSSVEGEESTRVILVRQGESTYNSQGRYQGRSDAAVLTPKGHLCACLTGVVLRDLPIETIYTSPLQRARQTTEEILAAFPDCPQPKLQVAQQLQDINLPAWEGLSDQTIREEFPEDYRCWKERPHQFQMVIPKNHEQGDVITNQPTFAPVLALYQQAEQFWHEILPRHWRSTILVISHGGTIRALISTAIGLSPDRYHCLQQSNCGISILNFSHNWDESAKLEALNLTSHLGEILPKLQQRKQGLRLLLAPLKTGAIDLYLQRLAAFLSRVPLDFCLSSIVADAQESASLILKYQFSSLVHLQVSRQDFSQVWQQRVGFNGSASDLSTGLVVAGRDLIRQSLNQFLGLNTSSSSLHLELGAICAIHFAGADSTPVLQSLNVFDWRFKSIREQIQQKSEINAIV